MSGLTFSQLQQYKEEGFVMVPDVFDSADIQPLRDELTEVIHAKALELCAEGKLCSLYENEPFERRLTRIFRDAPEIIGAIMGKGGGGHSGRAFFDFVRHPSLMEKIESLVGEEIVGSSVYRIRPKVPSWDRGAVPWHQDSGYFSPHCDKELIVTCWIPLVDATTENGCLRVLPRSHSHGVVRHFTNGPGGYLVINDTDLPPVEPVSVPVPLGGVLFMTNLTPHSSTQHEVDIVRWAIDVRYQSAKVPNNVGELPEEFDPNRSEEQIACYPPEADFVLQSRSSPESIVTEWEDFNEIRQRYQKNRPIGPQRGWTSV